MLKSDIDNRAGTLSPFMVIGIVLAHVSSAAGLPLIEGDLEAANGKCFSDKDPVFWFLGLCGATKPHDKKSGGNHDHLGAIIAIAERGTGSEWIIGAILRNTALPAETGKQGKQQEKR